MKKLSLVIMLVFASIVFANAQNQRGEGRNNRQSMEKPEVRAQKTVDRMDKTLSLSDEQKTEIKSYFIEKFTKQAKLQEENKKNKEGMKEDRKSRREEMMKKSKAEKAELDAKMEKILSPEQYKIYQEDCAKREEMMKKRRGNKRNHKE